MPTIVPDAGARYFSKGFNDQHASPAFEYIWDSGIVWQSTINGQAGALTTGGWRPVIPSDLGTTSNVSVSGLSLTVGAVAVTGAPVMTLTGNTPVSVVNTAPIPISGIVQTVVTGSVQSTFPNPVGVTGTRLDRAATYSGNPLAPYNFLNVGGRVVNPSGAGSVTGDYTTGQLAVLNFAPNGGIFVNQGTLESGYDSVTAKVEGGNSIPINISGIVLTQVTGAVSASFDSTPIVLAEASGNAYLAYISGKLDRLGITGGQIQTIVTGSVSATFDSASIVLAQASGNNLAVTTNVLLSGVSGALTTNLESAAYVTGNVGVQTSATISSNTVSGLATQFFGTPLVANAARKAWGIQNIGTGLLLIKLASTLPTTGDLTFVLKGATNAWAGDGAIWTDSPAVYTGPVSVTGFGGAPCVYQAWEL